MKFIPPREQHKELCEALLPLKYLHDPEIKELYDMFGLTDAEIDFLSYDADELKNKQTYLF